MRNKESETGATPRTYVRVRVCACVRARVRACSCHLSTVSSAYLLVLSHRAGPGAPARPRKHRPTEARSPGHVTPPVLTERGCALVGRCLRGRAGAAGPAL